MDYVVPLRRGGDNPSVPSRCGSHLLLLTCAPLMTSSHSYLDDAYRPVVGAVACVVGLHLRTGWADCMLTNANNFANLECSAYANAYLSNTSEDTGGGYAVASDDAHRSA